MQSGWPKGSLGTGCPWKHWEFITPFFSLSSLFSSLVLVVYILWRDIQAFYQWKSWGCSMGVCQSCQLWAHSRLDGLLRSQNTNKLPEGSVPPRESRRKPQGHQRCCGGHCEYPSPAGWEQSLAKGTSTTQTLGRLCLLPSTFTFVCSLFSHRLEEMRIVFPFTSH